MFESSMGRRRVFAIAIAWALITALTVAMNAPRALAGGLDIEEEASEIWMTDGSGMVDDIVSIGNTVYVAGSFENVRPSENGPDSAQPYLAAFDATSGELIEGFDPEINKPVVAMAVSPDESVLYIGGRFSQVNGSAAWRIAALDPETGERIAGFAAIVLEGDILAMDVDDDGNLYIGGTFGKVAGVSRPHVAKLDGDTGALFTVWDPSPNGVVRAVHHVASHDRVYIGGDFTKVSNQPGTKKLVGVSDGTGDIEQSAFTGIASVRGLDSSATKLWVAGGDSGGKALVYSIDSGARLKSWTLDGDAQAVEVIGDTVVFGGHWVSFFGPHVSKRIILIDEGDYSFDASFAPDLQGDPGIFAIEWDGTNLWTGGDITSAAPVNAIGFAKFASTNPPSDTQAPSKVQNLAVTEVDGDVVLEWDAATDNSGDVTYHIIRNGELFAVTSDTTFTDIDVDDGETYEYEIIAIDSAGNQANASAGMTITVTGTGSGGGDGGGGGVDPGEGGGGVVSTFIDIDDSVFENDIEWLAAKGITLGCNPPTNDKFCPNGVVTRGQMAAFLVRALDLPGGPEKFVDDNDSIFEANINALAASGITLGCNPPANDKYCPDAAVTRGQMAAFLGRAFDLPDGPEKFVDDNDSIFEGNINALAASGITLGCNPPTNDKYCPTAEVTRGQMAAFLHRAEAYLP